MSPSSCFITPLPIFRNAAKSELRSSSSSRRETSNIPSMTAARSHDKHSISPPDPAKTPSECPHSSAHAAIESQLFRVDPHLISEDPAENLKGFVKTRGSLVPGEEFLFWFTGDIFDFQDDQAGKHLFSFEAYNVGRMMAVDGGWRLLTREVALYKDPKTGKILEQWENPYTGNMTTCVHVWNDPVNLEFLLDSKRGKFKVPTSRMGDDVYWNLEVFLKYKSPMSIAVYPLNVASDTYRSTEMFQFFTSTSELESASPTAACKLSWVRVGQWLPWMEMGQRPGRLIYHCRGRRLKSGFEGLPDEIKDYVRSRKPEFMNAPNNFTTPNETSWTYMKKLLDAKGMPRADGRVAVPESEVAQTIPSQKRDLSKEQLRAYNGDDKTLPLYVSVSGTIFDVSSAQRHYRKGESYNCLAGRDASSAFVSGDLNAEEWGLGAVQDLKGKDKKNLEGWIKFFEDSYPIVGRLLDF